MSRMGIGRREIILLMIIVVVVGTLTSAQPIKVPCTISTPGLYELSEDARGIPDINGITIECDNVVLDGGNHFLGGDESREDSVGIYVNKYGGSITNITIKNFILEDWETAIGYNYVKGSESDTNLISKCDIVKSTTAIHIQYSDYITITNNQISDCSSGIIIEDECSNSYLGNNTISKGGQGVSIFRSPNSFIKSNNINLCTQYGLEVSESDGTTIQKNAISDNKYSAIKIDNSQDCIITGNNLAKTEVGAVLNLGNGVRNALVTDNIFASYKNVIVDDVSSNIVWNSSKSTGTNILGGPYLGGNYWTNEKEKDGFSDTAPDTEGYGIIDTPYIINNYNTDYLPLKKTTATKAPEDQVTEQIQKNTTIEPVVEIRNGTVHMNLTNNMTNSSILINQTSTNKNGSFINETNGTSFINQVKNQTIPTNTQDVPVGNISPNTSVNTSIPSTISPVSTSANKAETEIFSVLNLSVTNAYNSQNLSNESENTSLSEEEKEEQTGSHGLINQSPVVETNWSVSYNMSESGDRNVTPSASVGYIAFNSTVPGIDIVLVTKSGKEITLDPMVGNSMTVPVSTLGLTYERYTASKEGYNKRSELISPYPQPGETINISIDMIKTESPDPRVMSNTSVDSNATENLTSIEQNAVKTSNQTGKDEIQLEQINRTNSTAAVKESNSSSSAIVISNTFIPVVVSNGISTAPIHIIRATAGEGGTILPEGSVPVEEGKSVLFTIKPDEGHQVRYLIIDGIQTSPMTEYGFMNVSADHTIVTGFV